MANLDDRASAWSISSPLHARQYDNTSCGLYVIKVKKSAGLELGRPGIRLQPNFI